MKKSILIIDGALRCYGQLRNKLIANNYVVFQAASIKEAFQHFDIKAADLLLVDLDVPSDRIGTDLSVVTQLNPRIRMIGVTERSGGSEIAVRERLDGVAEKPFALGNLITFVSELLSETSQWKEFRYLPPRIPGLHARASHPPHRLLDHPPAYRAWGINE